MSAINSERDNMQGLFSLTILKAQWRNSLSKITSTPDLSLFIKASLNCCLRTWKALGFSFLTPMVVAGALIYWYNFTYPSAQASLLFLRVGYVAFITYFTFLAARPTVYRKDRKYFFKSGSMPYVGFISFGLLWCSLFPFFKLWPLILLPLGSIVFTLYGIYKFPTKQSEFKPRINRMQQSYQMGILVFLLLSSFLLILKDNELPYQNYSEFLSFFKIWLMLSIPLCSFFILQCLDCRHPLRSILKVTVRTVQLIVYTLPFSLLIAGVQSVLFFGCYKLVEWSMVKTQVFSAGYPIKILMAGLLGVLPVFLLPLLISFVVVLYTKQVNENYQLFYNDEHSNEQKSF